MNLLLDIGNTRIKWVLQEQGHWQPGEPLLRGSKAFKDIARPTWKELDAPERVLVSNVAGDAFEKSVRTWVKRRWKVTPEFLYSTASACGVSNAYVLPERLGADRWACLLAAHSHYSEAVLIIDCGTAITIDAIAADGKHLGGLIMPGLDLMTTALSGSTAGVALTEAGQEDVSLLGRSTETAVTGGVLYTAVALLDRAIADLTPELGRSVTTVVTGGDANRILPLLSTQPIQDPDLVLKGLVLFSKENECA